MAWDQGPYPCLDGIVQEISLNEAPQVIRQHAIDCVYGLFQEHHPRLFAEATGAIERDISTLLRVLLLERQRGAFDAPIIRHWGFDIHQLDLSVARALDAHIFCNREKFAYFTEPRSGGYALAGIPVIIDRRPGLYRYDELRRLGDAIELRHVVAAPEVRAEVASGCREREAQKKRVLL